MSTNQTTAPTCATENQTVTQDSYVSDSLYYFFEVYLSLGAGSLLSVFGTVSNIINAMVYYRQGLKDSVTVTYMALSVWDAGLCFLTVLSLVFLVIEKQQLFPEINVIDVQYVYVGYTRSVTHILSTIATVFISTELCICITVPLKVKVIFTKSRSILANFIIFVFAAACNCPAWATQGLQWSFDPQFNRTRLMLWLAASRPEVETFMATFTGAVIPVAAQTISIVCAVHLICGIHKSVEFRKQLPTTTSGGKNLPSKTKKCSLENGPRKSDKTASDKFTKLAIMTSLLTVKFLICNIPVTAVAVSRVIVPEINYSKQCSRLWAVLYISVYFSTLINSCGSILIYYRISHRFRKVFVSLFCVARNTQRART